VTEDLTLLPRHRIDKRTKEVFALSLERMNARALRGVAPFMDRLDEGSSAPRMAPFRARHCCMLRNSACPDSVFFLQTQRRILTALSRDRRKAPSTAFEQIRHCVQISDEPKVSVDRPAVH